MIRTGLRIINEKLVTTAEFVCSRKVCELKPCYNFVLFSCSLGSLSFVTPIHTECHPLRFQIMFV
jgi:hypothetical protein